MTLTGESLQTEEARDPIMSPRCLPQFVHAYLGNTDPRHPYASPVFADYAGLPPLLIQVEHEIIRDSCAAAAQPASASTLHSKFGQGCSTFSLTRTSPAQRPTAIAQIASFGAHPVATVLMWLGLFYRGLGDGVELQRCVPG